MGSGPDLGHFRSILGVLGLELGPLGLFRRLRAWIWAYFWGSGPDLGKFGPISGIMGLIWANLGLFLGSWA